MQQGVSTERAHGQRHQKRQHELKAALVQDGHQDHPEQRQQTDDGDGDEAPQPNPH